jgi:hypothetical protein
LRRALRGRVAGAVLGGLLALSAWAQPPSPDAGVQVRVPRFAWPKLQVLAHVESSDIVEAGGVPVALRAVHVKENVRDLVQRFADAFRDGGLYVPPGKEQPQYANNAVMLTALDPLKRITYTVVMMPQADGTTSLYLGEANHALARPPQADGDFAPLPPGATGVLRVNAEGSRTLSFQVPLAMAGVQTFYDGVLAKDGWKRGDEAGLYSRPGAELRLTLQKAGPEQTSVVMVHQQRSR